MSLATVEYTIGIIGALIVGWVAVTSLRAEWNSTGLDNNVTKVMLALLALGCVLVLLVGFHVIGVHPEAAAS